ncbi:WecB/TagA/CpsF family glycosyltransferase [Acidipila sp. EB88]|uniref:WecB/TagA/CpsF family glycosyltransferase n=1 Tax=Acidipila sp. EB88 TaxID=2305226 RepID=UPI000F60243E|nr:WecB/TagA/CpsF family glycosyltransferase [Acidipila sp. EB88]RRA47325.1 glycosyltransferase [Acidipila sp. EB88]
MASTLFRLRSAAAARLHDGTSMVHPSEQRVYFGAAPVDVVDMESAASWLLLELQQRQTEPPQEPLQIMGPNAFLVSLASRNRNFAEALNRATLCLPDGISVVWAARLLGVHMPERVPGGEFMERMCQLCAEHGLSIYLLGGMPGAAFGAAQALQQRYPGLLIAGTDCPPLGFEQDEQLNDAVLARITAAKPDLLCVALGAPKQEIWMLDECGSLPIGAALSVGAAFDTQAGLRKRAPRWTHGIGMEWLYRLAMEPRRLWKRYLLGNLAFLSIVAEEWGRQRRAQAVAKLLHSGPGHPLEADTQPGEKGPDELLHASAGFTAEHGSPSDSKHN